MYLEKHTDCIICGEDELNMVTIIDHNICQKCEKELIHTNVSEPIYSFFLDKLKVISLKK